MDTKSRASSLAYVAAVALLLVGCSAEGTGTQQERAVPAAQSSAEASSRIPEDEPVARVAAEVGPSVVK